MVALAGSRWLDRPAGRGAGNRGLWGAGAVGLQDGARVSRLDRRDGRVSWRGEAPDATEILTVIASTPGFLDVSFDAPVRSARNGRQNFALSFDLSAAHAEPETNDD